VVRESPSRRYEDGWRRSSYQNIYGRGAEVFQAQPELYGQQVSAAEWRQRLDTHEARVTLALRARILSHLDGQGRR